MKKCLLLCMFFSYLLFSQAVFACETGFACSISNLEQVRSAQEHLIYKYIDNLFKKEINENYFLSHPFYTENYDDLFLFKSIL